MNRFFVTNITLLCIVLFSCTKNQDIAEDSVNRTPISFNIDTEDVITKGIITDNSNMLKFGVFAFYYPSSQYWDSDNVNFVPNLFYNQKVIKSNGIWTYSPEKYYPPINNNISVFAYSPHGNRNISNMSSSKDSGTPFFDYSTPENVLAQTDLLIGTNIDIPIINTDKTPISIKFKHALACITFSAVPKLNEVKSIRVTEIHVSGTFVTKAKLSLDSRLMTTNSIWSDMQKTVVDDYFVSCKADKIISGTTPENVVTNGYDMFMIPQQIDNVNDTNIYILYIYVDKELGIEMVGEKDFTIPASYWQSGKIHNYVLTLGIPD